MKLLLILIAGLPILIIGGSFAGIQGGYAMQLDLEGSTIIPFIPWTAFIIFTLGMSIPFRSNIFLVRFISFITVVLVSYSIITYPLIVYNRGVYKIALSEMPSDDLRTEFDSHFKVNTVWCSNSSEGDLLLVKANDFSPDMEEFIKSAEQDVALDG